MKKQYKNCQAVLHINHEKGTKIVKGLHNHKSVANLEKKKKFKACLRDYAARNVGPLKSIYLAAEPQLVLFMMIF